MTQTTMLANRFIRQQELVDPKIFNTPIQVIGAGAIGSFTVLTLAKMGFTEISVYDTDIVEEHNLPNQYYPENAIGQEKVYALEHMVLAMTGIGIDPCKYLWDLDIPLKGLVISAVDNMATRKELFKAFSRNPDCVGLIDGRMGGQQAEVYCIKSGDGEAYKKYKACLWSDTEASQVRCTQKAVLYNVLWIASQIANLSRLLLEDKPTPWGQLYDFENVTTYAL